MYTVLTHMIGIIVEYREVSCVIYINNNCKLCIFCSKIANKVAV